MAFYLSVVSHSVNLLCFDGDGFFVLSDIATHAKLKILLTVDGIDPSHEYL